MSNYCTVQDVRNALAPKGVSEDNTEAGKTAATLPDWQIVDAIDEAETIINAYVSRRYKIENAPDTQLSDPNDEDSLVENISVAPKPIRAWTRTVAAYYATLTFREGKDLEERDPIQLRYNIVLQMLSGVRSGAFNLDLPDLDNTGGDGVEVFDLYEGTLFGLEDFGLAETGRPPSQILWPVNGSW